MLGRRQLAEIHHQQPSRSSSPYGYHVVTKTDLIRGLFSGDQLGRYQLEPQQAPIAAEMFNLYASGASLRAVCRWLEESHVPSPGGAHYWTPKTVRLILTNPVHKGEPAYGKREHRMDERRLEQGYKCARYSRPVSENQWVKLISPAIVSAELWETVQVRLAEGKATTSGNPNRKHMLSSLIRCPICGRRMLGKRRDSLRRDTKTPCPRNDHYYHCQEQMACQNPGKVVCNPKRYNGREAERAVVTGIQTIVRDPGLVDTALAAYRLQEGVSLSKKTCVRLHKELDDLDRNEQATAQAHVQALKKV